MIVFILSLKTPQNISGIKHIQSKDVVIIATNNPNIDIPKVVDEVERLISKNTLIIINL